MAARDKPECLYFMGIVELFLAPGKVEKERHRHLITKSFKYLPICITICLAYYITYFVIYLIQAVAEA